MSEFVGWYGGFMVKEFDVIECGYCDFSVFICFLEKWGVEIDVLMKVKGLIVCCIW